MVGSYLSGKECLVAIALIAAPSLDRPAQAETNVLPVGWTWGPMFSRACSAFGICETPKGVITVGGTFWSSGESTPPQKRWVADVYRLPLDSRRWTRLPDYPTAVGQALMVNINDRVFVIGGRKSDAAFAESNWVSINDSMSAWRRGPDLPKPTYGLVGGAFGSIIYAVTDPCATIEEGAIDPDGATIIAWNTAVENAGWTRISVAPDPDVGYRTGELVSGKLYLFGGAKPGGGKDLILQDAVWSFDLETKAWAKCRSLPYPMRDASAVTLDRRHILITGGCEEPVSAKESTDGQPRVILSNRCLLYDSVANTFEFIEPLRLAVADHGVIVHNLEVLVVAGEDSPYHTRTDLVQRGDVAAFLRKSMTQRGNSAP